MKQELFQCVLAISCPVLWLCVALNWTLDSTPIPCLNSHFSFLGNRGMENNKEKKSFLMCLQILAHTMHNFLQKYDRKGWLSQGTVSPLVLDGPSHVALTSRDCRITLMALAQSSDPQALESRGPALEKALTQLESSGKTGWWYHAGHDVPDNADGGRKLPQPGCLPIFTPTTLHISNKKS